MMSVRTSSWTVPSPLSLRRNLLAQRPLLGPPESLSSKKAFDVGTSKPLTIIWILLWTPPWKVFITSPTVSRLATRHRAYPSGLASTIKSKSYSPATNWIVDMCPPPGVTKLVVACHTSQGPACANRRNRATGHIHTYSTTKHVQRQSYGVVYPLESYLYLLLSRPDRQSIAPLFCVDSVNLKQALYPIYSAGPFCFHWDNPEQGL